MPRLTVHCMKYFGQMARKEIIYIDIYDLYYEVTKTYCERKNKFTTKEMFISLNSEACFNKYHTVVIFTCKQIRAKLWILNWSK
jgi:hypothetical protein